MLIKINLSNKVRVYNRKYSNLRKAFNKTDKILPTIQTLSIDFVIINITSAAKKQIRKIELNVKLSNRLFYD